MHGRIRIQKLQDGDGTWMDKERLQVQAYEYLCHIGEAKE
jgi:Ras GTPase-activating-like protein IQGAP2/3